MKKAVGPLNQYLEIAKEYAALGKQFLNSKAGLVVKLLFTLGILTLFFFQIDFEKLTSTVTDFKWSFLILAVVMMVLRNVISAWRFQVMSAYISKVPLLTYTKHYLIASMFNIFLPSTVGGDALRVFMADKEGVPKKKGLMLVLCERFIGLYAFGILCFAGSLFMPLPWHIQLGVLGIAVVFSIGFWFIFFKKTTASFIPQAFIEMKKRKDIIYKVLAISVFYQFFSITIRYVLALMFGIDISIIPFIVFIPLINLITMIPLSIGGMGFRELGFVYFFSEVAGYSTEVAALLAIGAYILIIGTGIIGAIVYFYESVILGIKYQLKNN